MHGKSPGNVQRRFHGTRMKCVFNGTFCKDKDCSACRILESGFDMSHLGKWSGNNGDYGGGIYFTSLSSTAKGYGLAKEDGFTFGNGNWMKADAGNCILLCSIACGNAEHVKGKTDEAIDTSQFNSRVVIKGNGVDELVIPQASQAKPRFVLVF